MSSTTHYANIAIDNQGRQQLFQVSPFRTLYDAIEACVLSYANMDDEERENVQRIAVLSCSRTETSVSFGDEVWAKGRMGDIPP